MHPKKRQSKCICGKHRHKSRGAAEAQIRALKRLQESDFGKKDFKTLDRLQVRRYRDCERGLNDGNEVWHVGHK